jgi:serine/threonine protein kinase
MVPRETVDLNPNLGHLGRYRLLEKLGEGGMGTVFLAQDTSLERRVAIKVLPARSVNDAGAVARFQREAKALAKLAHPGIVQAYDSEQDGDRHFLVMEYVEGGTLAGLLKQNGRLHAAVAADYIHQAALALQHAHDKGLVHRDLKPSNLLITPDRRVKILDLGLARFLQDQVGDPNLTREGSGLGTPDYAAPEQYRDAHRADARADLYSLGCTLYHLVTGQVPFPGSSLSEKWQAHSEKEPTPIEELCADVPGGLALIIRRMMAKRPRDRFQTAREVAEALAPYVAGSSASFQSLRTTATWHRGQLTLREFDVRRPWNRWVLGSVLGTALLAVAALTWYGLFRDGESPSEADSQLASRDGKKDPSALGKGKDLANSDSKKAAKSDPVVVSDPNTLTVAQDGSGKFRSITAALKTARPRNVIRVLDDKTYAEPLLLTNPKQHAGIVLESPNRATLTPAAETRASLVIRDVPHVKVSGFRFLDTEENQPRFPVTVSGRCPGVTLEDLDIQTRSKQALSIRLISLDVRAVDRPVVVKKCRIQGGYNGIVVYGSDRIGDQGGPCQGVLIQDNRITRVLGTGIFLEGALRDIQVTGNVVWNCGLVCLELLNLATGSEGILLANNTLFDSGFDLFRVVESPPFPKYSAGQVEFRNNLLFDADRADMGFFRFTGGLLQSQDAQVFFKLWRLDHNWRDRSGKIREMIPALGAKNHLLKKSDLTLGTLARPDLVRPRANVAAAKQGAGKEDKSLPLYAGAVPPKGTKPWDWGKTWQSRSRKTGARAPKNQDKGRADK